MATFEELYQTLLAAAARRDLPRAIEHIRAQTSYDPTQLDCLLNPKKHPIIWRTAPCDCPDGTHACANACAFDAITTDATGHRTAIDLTACVGCTACVDACHGHKLTASRDSVAVMQLLRHHEGRLVYALIAPAFHGQLGETVTPGMLRSAFGQLGFDGMVEVALFADILTLKEAFEFDKNIQSSGDYQLTSCCCPMWIAMIRKVYSQLMPHVPGSVSPMIACGRAIKQLHPDAITIFIGPCLAKKAEARENDLLGAIDHVLTFQELSQMLSTAGIDLCAQADQQKDHSSRAGRLYARTGGVSEAVRSTVERLNPHRKVEIRARQANGVPACKAMLSALCAGEADANFFEGMGCVGGCVGGPKRLIATELGAAQVTQYAEAAACPTPIDNPYVIELLHRLGIDTVEQLLEQSDIFTRRL